MNRKIGKKKLPELFQLNCRPYGHSYVKWTENWWKWAFSLPIGQNPILDKTGENCGRGQDGPVWYLAGTTCRRFYARRRCIIPKNKAILFPIIVSLFSRSEKPNMSTEELVRYTSKDIELTSSLETLVDGTTLTELSKYRVRSYFRLRLVDDNIWGVKAGFTEAASDGFWVFLKPLSLGNHTIIFQGVEPNFRNKIRYNIVIM